jgi:hypothetical protein
MRLMHKINTIVTLWIALIPFLACASTTKLSIAESGIDAKIIGTWQTEFNDEAGHGVQYMTYSADKTYRAEAYIDIGSGQRLLQDEGTYAIHGNKLSYVVSKSNFVHVGAVSYDIIKTINDNEIVCLDKSGKEHRRTRVK